MLRALVPKLAEQSDLDMHFLSIYDSTLSPSEKDALGVPVHEISRRSRSDLGFAARLLGTLRRLAPTVVHGHSHSGKFAGRMGAIAAGVPNIVFSEHGDDARGAIHWSVNRLLNARTARFIVFTDGERQRFAHQHALPLERVAVIPNGIPVPAATDAQATRRELGLRKGDFAIVTPARLVHQKNHELLLRAVAALRASGRDHVRLFIVGEGPRGETLRATATELGLDGVVQFLGFRNDAPRLTAAADVLALSSLWEKMPLVLGEAMLSGIPVVSTPWTGIDTLVTDGETGYLSADWSVEAYTAALGRAIDDPAARLTLANRAREVAMERFDLERAVRAHADLYRTLASAAPAGRLARRFRSA